MEILICGVDNKIMLLNPAPCKSWDGMRPCTLYREHKHMHQEKGPIKVIGGRREDMFKKVFLLC